MRTSIRALTCRNTARWLLTSYACFRPGVVPMWSCRRLDDPRVLRRRALPDSVPGMRVRVATWNLNRRGHATWTRLTRLRDVADVILVQEARPPLKSTWQVPVGMAAYPPLDREDRWGPVPSGAARTGIVVLNPAFELRPCARWNEARATSRRGTLTLRDLYAGDEYCMTLASGYGMFEEMDVSERSMRLIVDDLEPLISADTQVVLGGDFNMWIQPWQGTPYPPYKAVFDRLDSLGMYDCLAVDQYARTREPLEGCPCGGGIECRHVRTLRHMNNPASVPWQVDYIFLSRSLRPLLRSARTLDDDSVWAASDHCPVLAEFDVPTASPSP